MLKLISGKAPDPAIQAAQLQAHHAQRWLQTQCSMIRLCRGGAIYKYQDGEAALLAVWPDSDYDPAVTLEALERACVSGERLELALPAGSAGTRLVHPIKLFGASGDLLVVVDVDTRQQPELKAIGNLIGWGSEWLPMALKGEQDRRGPSRDVFPLLAICLDQVDFEALATTLVTQLAQRFHCQRVSLGLRRRRQTEVAVLSHTARFKQEANLLRAIALAMDESLDQDRTIRFPGTDGEDSTLTYAHEALARETGDGSILTLPFSHHSDMMGALTLERDGARPFEPDAVDMLERTMAVIAPVMLLMRREQMGLLSRMFGSIRTSLRALLGPAHFRAKAAALTLLAAVIFFSLATGTWRVTADAVVEGSVQRSIAAPIDGFIKSAEARAGDLVEAGDLLGTLDDGDLNLERLKWSTLRQQLVSESREAVAEGNRAEVSIIAARIEQARAELQLLDEQLARTRISAPFSGVVIDGDLSQRLGTPVSRGEILFRVAPLDDYRVVLKVDERDIAAIDEGQHGTLVLASMPGRKWPLHVDRITSVSSPEEGSNYFRVEAALEGSAGELRPGMEGVGKIELGEAKLIWIWSRELLAWLKLQIWTWWR